MKKPAARLRKHGMVVIQRDGPYYIAMMPDGHVRLCPTKAIAEKTAREWLHKHVDPEAINLMTIEWR